MDNIIFKDNEFMGYFTGSKQDDLFDYVYPYFTLFYQICITCHVLILIPYISYLVYMYFIFIVLHLH